MALGFLSAFFFFFFRLYNFEPWPEDVDNF